MANYRITSGAHDITLTNKASIKAALRNLTLNHLVTASPIIKVENLDTGNIKYFSVARVIEAKEFYKDLTSPFQEMRDGEVINEE